MSISAKQLAEKLQVSAATVSMVLNNKPGISEATRQKVFAAAREYGYEFRSQPQLPAAGYEIHFIIYKKHGYVVSDTPFFTELIEGVVETCRRSGCTSKISYHYEHYDFQLQAQQNGYLKSSGIILLGTEMNPEDLRHFLDLPVPAVVLDCYFDELTADYVVINNNQGAFTAAGCLYNAGHRTIGYLRSSFRISNFSQRSNGYYNALRHYGLNTIHPYVIEVTPTAEQGYHDVLHYLEQNPELPTAFFADNDIVAAAAMRAFSEYDPSLPQRLSVIGFDDMPFCHLMTPSLSTMRVPKQALAAAAVKRLLEKLASPDDIPITISIATEPVLRASIHENISKQTAAY